MGAARTASQSPDPKFKEGLENITKMPEGKERTMSMMELMFTGGSGSQSGIMGRRGKATMTGDVGAGPFKKFTDKAEQDKNDTREVTSSQSSDFDMDKVRERLLAKAKEERTARSQQYAQEKQVYNQSLPDSVRKDIQNTMKDSPKPLQFMVRGG